MDNRVHALSHEMQSKSTRTKLARRQTLEGIRLRLDASILEDNFEAGLRAVLAVELVKLNHNRAPEVSPIRVTNHVGNGFVQSQRDFVAVLFAETDRTGQWRNNSPDAAEYQRIA